MSYISIDYLDEAERNLFALQREYESIKASIVRSWKGDAAAEALGLAEQNLAGMSSLGSQISSLSIMILKAMNEKESSESEEEGSKE